MNVFGIGLPEMLLIFGVGLLVFGPKKLPEMGKALGKTLKGFQEASSEFQNEFKKAADVMEESVNKPVDKPMQATIEPPPQIKAAEEIAEATLAEPEATKENAESL
jgi:sec-independent protein translocase protein TatA